MAKKSSKDSFETKVRDLDPYFVDEVLSASPEQLKSKLVEITKYALALQEERDNDEDLKNKKEIAKEAGAVYAEGLKAAKMKSKYIVNLLNNN